MGRRSFLRRTRNISGRQLATATALALLVAIAFAAVVQVSVAGAFRSRSPQVALSFAPFDAEARAKLAATLTSGSPSPEARQAARNLALDAIRRDPLNPVALRALAFGQDHGTDETRARAADLLLKGQRLSRRDAASQLWLVNFYLQRNDIPRLMRHFDIALRTSSSSQQMLFPLISVAASDQRIANALVERLQDNPSWRQDFAVFLQNPQAPPANAAYIARRTLDPSAPKDRAVIDALVYRFGVTGDYDLAWDVYHGFGLDKGTSRALLRDGNFEAAKAVPPFGWVLSQDADRWAAREARPDGKGKALRLAAGSGQSGVVAWQLLKLEPGHYTLSGVAGDVPRGAFERPVIAVACAEQERLDTLASATPAATSDPVKIGLRFDVPPGCPFQRLSIALAGYDGAGDNTPWIDDLELVRN
jgi:hypothetical protein